MAQALLEQGADPSAKNKKGKTARELAEVGTASQRQPLRVKPIAGRPARWLLRSFVPLCDLAGRQQGGKQPSHQLIVKMFGGGGGSGIGGNDSSPSEPTATAAAEAFFA